MRTEFKESSAQRKQIINLLQNIENKLNLVLAERTNHGVNNED